MKAVTYSKYGRPDVLRIENLPVPVLKSGHVMVQVHASSVSTADWRLRAAAFPGIMQVPGRLMFGICAPRHPVLGMDFAGTVTQVAPDVTAFKPGDRVFGFAGKGGHAEYLPIHETGAITRLPEGLSFAEGAALPFGGLSALVFLRDYAGLQAGQKVLVIGGSGGVGAYAVQIARAMGAHVTAVGSEENHPLLTSLGADQARDYRAGPYLFKGDDFDVIFDTVGAATFDQAKMALAPTGVFVPLNFGLPEIMAALLTSRTNGQRVKIGVNEDRAADLQVLVNMWRTGGLRPVIDREYPMEDVVAAHTHVESRHRKGAVILTIREAA